MIVLSIDVAGASPVLPRDVTVIRTWSFYLSTGFKKHYEEYVGGILYSTSFLCDIFTIIYQKWPIDCMFTIKGWLPGDLHSDRR